MELVIEKFKIMVMQQKKITRINVLSYLISNLFLRIEFVII